MNISVKTQKTTLIDSKPKKVSVLNSAKNPATTPAAEILKSGLDVFVPFNLLFISDENVRKVRNPAGLPELAALIDSQGLLQRLTVVAADGGLFGVAGGGRRYQAMALLVAAGKMAADHPVECKLYDSARAVALSIAENSGREAMHPADQMEGFLTLIGQGLTVAQVAGRFGVSVVTVERRLRLARIAPRFMAMYRTGDIQPDQLQALALTEDHALQESAWDGLSSYQRSAYHLRDVLTEAEISGSSMLAKFVGVAAYEAAGGTVRRDLFAEDSTEGYFQDSPLLTKLALAKLEAAGVPVVAEGWAWVEFSLNTERLESRQYGRESEGKREATESEKELLANLDSAQNLAQQALYEHLRGDEDAATFEEIAEALETSHLEAERCALEARAVLYQWTPEQLARAGAIVKLTYGGKIEIHRGLVRASDKKAAIASMARNGEAVPREMKVGMRAEYSESHMKDMTAHRTAALQAALVQNPRVALVALVNRMASSLFDGYTRSDGGIKINIQTTGDSSLAQDATDFGESPAAAVLAEAETQWGDRLPGDPAARFTWLMTQDESVLLDLLAYCTARCLNVTTGHARSHDHSDVLAEMLGVDMADWWTPTASKFVGSVSKSKAVEAIKEATGADVTKEAGTMKKVEATAFCADKLNGTRWLPAPLRPCLSDVTAIESAQSDGANE